jgi:hypothetical protein
MKNIETILNSNYHEELEFFCDVCAVNNATFTTNEVSFSMIPDTFVVYFNRNNELDRKNMSRVNLWNNDGRMNFLGVEFSLLSVLYHSGEYAHRGHYYCESKRPSLVKSEECARKHRIYTFDDTKVEKVDDWSSMNSTSKGKKSSEWQLAMYKKL